MAKYIAHINPLNAEKIGCQPHGTAEFIENGDQLHIKVEMFDTPKNIEHWEHFHGFPDGKVAQAATMTQDVNHDALSIYLKLNQYQELRWCHLMRILPK